MLNFFNANKNNSLRKLENILNSRKLKQQNQSAVVRKILLSDDRIDLPEDIKKSLSDFDDLKGPGMEEMDPLNVFDKFYERNDTKFEALDGIIEGARDEVEAAREFIKEFDGFDLIPRDDKADGGLSYLMGV